MSAITLTVNGSTRTVDVDPATPLLYILRNDPGLQGPRFGCGLGQCGACSVIINGSAVRSCVTPVSAVKGDVTTLEGLARNGSLQRCGGLRTRGAGHQGGQAAQDRMAEARDGAVSGIGRSVRVHARREAHVESFIDELAAAAKADPVEFRLRLLTDGTTDDSGFKRARSIACVKAAAKAYGWDARPSPKPRTSGNLLTGRGIAYSFRGQTVVAQIVDVEVNRQTGRVYTGENRRGAGERRSESQSAGSSALRCRRNRLQAARRGSGECYLRCDGRAAASRAVQTRARACGAESLTQYWKISR